VQLIQSGIYVMEEGEQDRIRLFIQKNNKLTNQDDVRSTLAAKDFVELRRKYPNETALYLEPIFRDLGQLNVLFAVDERAAWQALATAYQAPADLKQKVQQLVKQLDSDDPKQREQASHALEQIGQPAAMLLMNQDREPLSEEQSSRIDAFLAPYKPLSDDEAKAARKSPSFLIMALAADDEKLRSAALEQLKSVVSKPVTFDVNADRQTRLEALIRLRDELAPPSTEPSTREDAARPDSNTTSPPQP
jgi:hypothetical protein